LLDISFLFVRLYQSKKLVHKIGLYSWRIVTGIIFVKIHYSDD